MNRVSKKAAFAALLILLCAVVLLTACTKEPEYKKEINPFEVATALSKTITSESEWVNEAPEVIEEYVEVPEYVRAGSIYYAQNTNNLDEFGIFFVEEGQAKAVRSLLTHGYLEKRYNENREWYDSYMPAETPKLRDAEVRVYGNCVAYAILSPERRTAFFDECEKMLRVEK